MRIFVNGLTITRIIGTLILPILWIYLDPKVLLSIVFLILITDFFDGFLARRFNVQSLFGSLLDVIADKAFGVMMLIIIGNYEPIFYLLALMEICIALINVVAAIKGATTISSFLGKTKMWLLGASTILALLAIFDIQIYQALSAGNVKALLTNFMNNEGTIILTTASITVGAQFMVALDYTKHIIKELKNKKTKIKYNFKDDKELKYVLFDTEYYLKNKKLPLSKHLLK